jgi:hypothetical protein
MADAGPGADLACRLATLAAIREGLCDMAGA